MTATAATTHPSRRQLLLQELGHQMSAISEEAWCSAWAPRIEDELPAVLTRTAKSGKAASYRDVEISPVYAEWLVSIAAELGHWAMLGEGGAFIPHTPGNTSPVKRGQP